MRGLEAWLACVLCWLLPWLQCERPAFIRPEQVHLSSPGEPNSMTVTWTTFDPAESVVEFGPEPEAAFTRWARGNATLFVDGGKLRRAMFIHRVTLRDLLPGQRYVYRCGSKRGWSRTYSFQALLNGANWSPRFAIYGDMGLVNPQSLPRLQREAEMGLYDVVLHVGDFAYNLDTDNAYVGDAFMRSIEPVAALVPYMTCPGNHEQKYNFSNYRARFSMPGDTESLWYSWDLGPAHIVSFSTEVYFFLTYGQQLVAEQFRWLERDLQEATRPERRKERPWIITMGHRPMYCSNNDQDDCTEYESIVRQGLDQHQYGLEGLFYKYGVDLELWAHEHSYERLWPVFNYTVHNGSTEAPYTNPGAPVHIITGSAGCKERLDPFVPDPRAWSAVRIEDYGYSHMQILNKTHLWLEQVSDDQSGKVVDGIWLIKEHHGPESWH
ncbi:acid phosphatase type 7 [Hemicordylus capensis]|uniref:acid phosphatase type 7 n=1 Tax=Hemicordylus capensis TaxID=884348 RepID=UPI0023046419|nr:acid phosphatase type 7 [Hemicordylus capensis]XP_053124436.1 acid phosphatase type 7 [Hemicordylus capensis]XP_053124437.1 acid phosphatase type 7 [Hemicordylus capensis]XP_053124438.1 acid phosphatase type 7 [Hemicordylus capensis]XP_053124439.1 acid phosphatase type 7 [Hemicordylus capensis]XP_053124441.1 acid phosphatase type 7 [Hemicordylus capensis]XP_053124442.1 acid phosphatase type 7 [Hemicordylus capensis]XP_053124443.1 acid phosphatase type 7 [Hemicordylus capensis]